VDLFVSSSAHSGSSIPYARLNSIRFPLAFNLFVPPAQLAGWVSPLLVLLVRLLSSVVFDLLECLVDVRGRPPPLVPVRSCFYGPKT